MKLKLFEVNFKLVYPTNGGLIILAKDLEEAVKIASETILHTEIFTVTEIKMDESKVVFYASGDY